MKCRFEFYPIYSPGSFNTHTLAACRCVAHGFDMGQIPMTATTLCPIGMIEDARDEALERIRNERG
jgi:hypothetical protein